MNRRWCIGVLSIGLVACASSTPESEDPTLRADMLDEVQLSMSEAVTKAQGEVAGGVLVEAEVELSEGGVAFEVEFLVDGVVRELYLDAGDGHVLSNEVDDEDLPEAEASAARLVEASVDLAAAIATVEREVGGLVFEAELGDEGFEVAVLADEGPLGILVSLEDGSILAREPLDAGPELEEEEDEEDEEEDD